MITTSVTGENDMSEKYYLEVTLRFEVQADDLVNAASIVREEMVSMNADLADHYVYEWTEPVEYANKF